MNSPVNTVLERLEANGSRVKKQRAGYMACCPAHADHNPSLSINERTDGGALLFCHAGCDTKSVLDVLDLTFADLFAQPLTKTAANGLQRRPSDIKIVSAVNGDRRPADKKMVGTAEYVYLDENGEPLYRVVRRNYSDGTKDFRQGGYLGEGRYSNTMKGVRRVLYHLPEVREAVFAKRLIIVVEGEKDADTLTKRGYTATCNPGGADNGNGNKWTPEMTAQLKGAKQVRIITDNDPPGEQHAKAVFHWLKDAGNDVEIWRPTLGKDITEHLANGGTF